MKKFFEKIDQMSEKSFLEYERKAWDIETEYYQRTGSIPDRHVIIELDKYPYKAGYADGATQIQKDLLESASEGFEEFFKNGRSGKGETPSQIEVWQACALFHKAQIDTLKQRELGYQSDLRHKDEEIEKLNKELIEFKKINQSEAILNTSLHRKNKELTEKLNSAWRLAVDMETKYQEAVKDIEWLSKMRDYDTYSELNHLYAIKAKYNLDKKEG